jgi:mono/diheme cytochrome c family protein
MIYDFDHKCILCIVVTLQGNKIKTFVMKKLLVLSIIATLMYACNSGSSDSSSKSDSTAMAPDANGEKIPTPGGDAPAYDPNRGEGKFTHVDVGDKLDVSLAANGEKIYGVKCSGCHKLTEEKLVGPGWKGVSERHKPEWIMNFITNTDEMLNKDPKAQAQLEICLVRMPNQSLSDDDARQLLEFMRKNDGVQ